MMDRMRTTMSEFLRGPHAPWLTHGCLAGITLTYFGMLLFLPIWIAFIPAAILAHRIATLLHEYRLGFRWTNRRLYCRRSARYDLEDDRRHSVYDVGARLFACCDRTS